MNRKWYGYGEEFSKFTNLNNIGAIIVKGLSLKPRAGNPPPRVVETAAGMLNSIGLQNVGIDSFIKDKMPFLRKYETAVIANFFGDSVEEYRQAAMKLDKVKGLSGLEMNISCPNKQEGWLEFSTNEKLTFMVVKAVREVTKLPLIVKLSPNVTDITPIAKAAEEGGADAISLINTLTGMAIDIKNRRPKLANIRGGLSGPAIKPVALYQVWKVKPAVSIPVIGIGGIMTWQDAIEFFIAGASAVQVGTANFTDPDACVKIVKGLQKYCRDEKLSSITKLTGTLRVYPK
jgi:dihydroorotate dehydrogenase (NAD+) catalytic subunit